MDHDHSAAGFKERTRVAEARDRLLSTVTPLDRTRTVSLMDADGCVIAEELTAARSVPHYERAAMDGYAVRAEDTFGGDDQSPTVLRVDDEITPGTAVRVHTGSELPEKADAVVLVEQTERETSTEIAVFDAVARGENVAPVGEDVQEGQRLYSPGHRLRPSDLGLLKSVGFSNIEVYERPQVSVIPTGEELVQCDPDPGEVIETNGQTVTHYVHRWGGSPTYQDIVPDDPELLRTAICRDSDHDLIVTTGGSSVGERDILPDVVADLGTVLVHGVALKPGHPVAFGRARGTPILMLPGYPVSCIVNAVQFLRPALESIGNYPVTDPPTSEAKLTRKIHSEPGIRTFVRVELGVDDGENTATSIRASGAGVLSSVALADGWVIVPESSEGFPADRTVTVEHWERSL